MSDYLSQATQPPKPYRHVGGMSSLAVDSPSMAELRKISNTEQALKSIEAVSSRLDALVSELERRISPVLLATAPSAGQGEQRGAGSPLSEKMFNEESALRGIADRIDSIISRVDL